MADQRYYNMNSKGEDNRYKVNTNILRMMNANPALGTGYIIGSMLGENYWGKKRAKTRTGTKEEFYKKYGMNPDGSVGADANGTYGTDNNNVKKEAEGSVGSMSPMERRAQIINDMRNYLSSQGKTSGVVRPSDVAAWKGRNEALQEYMKGSPNGRVLYSGLGSNVQTPQQANKPAVTTENAGNGGGVPTPADHWNNIMNGSTYNPGSTGMYTNGARNLGNVIGADANGVYGVNSGPVIGANENGLIGVPNGGSAPSAANIPRSPQTVAPNPNPAPIPYTAEQLQQIRDYGGFTPEELRRAGAEAAIPQPVVAAPAGGGYTASDESTPIVPTNPAPTGDQMRLIKGDAPAPEVYDYAPGYTSPQDMDNLAWDRGNYNALARAKENLGVFGQALARIPEFFNGQQKARDRWNNRK